MYPTHKSFMFKHGVDANGAPVKVKATEWFVYIPEEGDWPIKYDGDSAVAARIAYLAQAGRVLMPVGAVIWSRVTM